MTADERAWHDLTSRDWLFIAACVAALWLLNAIWLIIDTRPPVWDMAIHQVYALHYVPGFPSPEGWPAWRLSGDYPPFVHLVIALTFWLFHPDPDIAAFVNLPATFLLLWSTYQLGRYFASSAASRWACFMTVLIPYMMWMSREPILDYWLSAWVAFAWVALLRTEGFKSRFWTGVFGLACGFGLLTKWLFAGFLAAPFLYIAVRHRLWEDKRRILHAAAASIIAGALAGAWYLPNLPRLIQYFSENAQIGVLEGEPPVLSFQSFIYYLRLLEGYQLYLILFLVLGGGILFVFSRRAFRDPAYWIVCIAGGWLAVTLLRTKDPRYTLPLLGPILVAPGAWLAVWRSSVWTQAAKILLVAFLIFQAYAANFGVSWLPLRIILMPGYQGYVRWDWQLFSQDYFDILGAPRRENWKIDEILARITEESRRRGSGMSVALVPDMARFNTSNFLLAANVARIPASFAHPRSAAAGVSVFEGYDFVIMTEREQGMNWTTTASGALNQLIVGRPAMFKLIGTFNLPNGDTARLYFVDRRPAR